MVDTPTKARSKLAAAHTFGPPEPEIKDRLRANLATSNLDREIRVLTDGGRDFDEHELEHLVGLLLRQATRVTEATAAFCEDLVRRAVREDLDKQDGAE